MIRWTTHGTNIFAAIWLLISGVLIFSKLVGIIDYSWFAVILIIFLPALVGMVLFAFLVSADIIMFGKGINNPPIPHHSDDKDDDSSK